MEISDEAYLKAAVELFLAHVKNTEAAKSRDAKGCAEVVASVAKALKEELADK